MRFLKRTTNVVPLGQALKVLAAGGALPARAASITFDDGYLDNLRTAVPALRSLGLPATFFLVPGLLSGSVPAWWEVVAWAFDQTGATALRWEGEEYPLGSRKGRHLLSQVISERLKRRSRAKREEAVTQLVDQLGVTGSPRHLFMDWSEANTLLREGFSVGSHTSAHAILTEESGEEQHRDLLDSRYDLERELDTPVDLLAYPNGTPSDFDTTTIDAARRAGYRAAVTTVHGWNKHDTPPYEIRRFVMRPELGVKAFLRPLATVGHR